MEPNTKGLLPDRFKPLQNKAFIVLNALFDNNVSGSTIKLPEEPKIAWFRIYPLIFTSK
jgi:hypothetical protein